MSNSSGQQSETTFEETYAAGADCCASEPTRRAIFHFTHAYLHRKENERESAGQRGKKLLKKTKCNLDRSDSWCDESIHKL